MAKIKICPIKRFWNKVEKTDYCWNWTGAKTENGYGRFWNGNAHELSHRFSWRLNDIILKGLLVLHHCDNRKCVNPEHLFIGTQKDNFQDMVKKERNKIGFNKNARYRNAKLTVEQVKEIRIKHSINNSLKTLSLEYHTSRQNIHSIVTRKRWKQVE